MTIRPFHPKDRAAIDELAIKLHAYFAQVDDTAESLPFASSRDAHGYMQRMIDDSENVDGAMYVAEENGQMVGFIQGVIIDQSAWSRRRFRCGACAAKRRLDRTALCRARAAR